MKKINSAIIFSLLIIGMFAAISSSQPVNACVEAIYIRADGSIDPPNTNLSTLDNITYTFLGDIDMPIVVQRNHIIIDGAGNVLHGSGTEKGIALSGRTNVTIQNLNIEGFKFGIYVCYSSSSFIIGNNITANIRDGIRLEHACHNGIYRNSIIENGHYGIKLIGSGQNRIIHNSFVDNAQQAGSFCQSMNTWDDGYPEGGNYWSDHDSADLYRGVHQDIDGIDGIADLPYSINEEEMDNYPLMGPFTTHIMLGLNVPVYPDPEVALIFENVTKSGNTMLTRTMIAPPPPQGFFLVGSYFDIQVTAEFSDDVIVRIAYDDSGLTLEEEMNLRLMQTDIIPGDVNVDGKVNCKDIWAILKALCSYPGHPRWNPSCDLNNDGKVNLKDLWIALRNYGKKSEWTDITTYVDIEGNAIFGIAGHFSIEGVHGRAF